MEDNRIRKIRAEILDPCNPANVYIKTFVPYDSLEMPIPKNSIDFLFSQAVLEHVNHPERTYEIMKHALKKGGVMSHTIDFSCHYTTRSWNGHWLYNDFQWAIIQGRRSFLLNRMPFSKHVELHKHSGFEMLHQISEKRTNKLRRKSLAKRFKKLSDDDLNTTGAYVLSMKV